MKFGHLGVSLSAGLTGVVNGHHENNVARLTETYGPLEVLKTPQQSHFTTRGLKALSDAASAFPNAASSSSMRRSNSAVSKHARIANKMPDNRLAKAASIFLCRASL